MLSNGTAVDSDDLAATAPGVLRDARIATARHLAESVLTGPEVRRGHATGRTVEVDVTLRDAVMNAVHCLSPCGAGVSLPPY